MNWTITLSKSADKFIDKNSISDGDLFNLIKKAILYLQGEDVNVDIKKLKGDWEGYFRIRRGEIRVIADFDFEDLSVFVEEIDFRGNVYD